MNHKKPAALIIIDGLGHAQASECNAVSQAYMPTFNELLHNYPTTLLQASGTAVGLPEDTPGNSEVGHLTLGAGTIIKQPLTIINDAIQNNSFFNHKKLIEQLTCLKKNKHNLHIMGLISYGKVHSCLSHLYAYIKIAKKIGIQNIYIHGFLDGRDTPIKTAEKNIKEIQNFCNTFDNVHIASLQGRFYAMDRNKNWQLTDTSYKALTQKQHTTDIHTALEDNYKKTGSEEFLPPIQLPHFQPISNQDGLIFFNFRPDRARQLTTFFIQKEYNTNPLKLTFFITPFSYGPQYQTTTLFEKQVPQNTLNDVLHDTFGFSLFSIAETEKYAHITYFFNGGKEAKRLHETRVLIPSITRKSYKQHPEMSAPLITQALLESLQYNPCDFYIINYANADMVGHTGDMHATTAALECIDAQLKKLFDTFVTQHNGILFITADHGNAEKMCGISTQEVITSHTTNPVYFSVVAQELRHKKNNLSLEKLSDVAPFIITTLEKR